MQPTEQHITYCPDTAALVAEVEQLAPELVSTDENGDTTIGPLTKVRTRRNGDETISVVKGLPELFHNLTSLEVLGTITGAPYNAEATFVSPEAQAIYERVTGVLEVAMVAEEDGSVTEIKKPYIIGVVG